MPWKPKASIRGGICWQGSVLALKRRFTASILDHFICPPLSSINGSYFPSHILIEIACNLFINLEKIFKLWRLKLFMIKHSVSLHLFRYFSCPSIKFISFIHDVLKALLLLGITVLKLYFWIGHCQHIEILLIFMLIFYLKILFLILCRVSWIFYCRKKILL